MRLYLLLLGMVVVGGCAAPRQVSDADRRQFAIRMVATYGPQCEAAGFAKGTQDYKDCIFSFAKHDVDQQRSQAAMAVYQNNMRALQNMQPAVAPKVTVPTYGSPNLGTHCTTQYIGGTAYTNCN